MLIEERYKVSGLLSFSCRISNSYHVEFQIVFCVLLKIEEVSSCLGNYHFELSTLDK